MNRYDAARLIALGVLALALPLYALREPARMEQARRAQSAQFIADAASLYVEQCIACHGAEGQGTGAIPALNSAALASADFDYLFQRIAHAPHGTSMAVWHVGEGARLTSYQAEALATFIRQSEWKTVSALAEARLVALAAMPPLLPSTTIFTADPLLADPHSCVSCHEEPAMHANRFGLDCARCHGQDSWTPALLTRHVFALDHGGAGTVACQVCHAANYADHTCYGCHDHTLVQMENVHAGDTRYNIRPCISCHPTGSEAIDRQLNETEQQAATPISGH
jgi:mono/diheme cytochrome c family protein